MLPVFVSLAPYLASNFSEIPNSSLRDRNANREPVRAFPITSVVYLRSFVIPAARLPISVNHSLHWSAVQPNVEVNAINNEVLSTTPFTENGVSLALSIAHFTILPASSAEPVIVWSLACNNSNSVAASADFFPKYIIVPAIAPATIPKPLKSASASRTCFRIFWKVRVKTSRSEILTTSSSAIFSSPDLVVDFHISELES